MQDKLLHGGLHSCANPTRSFSFGKNIFAWLCMSLVFGLPSRAIAQINLSPAKPVLAAGGSLTITADRPVTVSLSGTGSLSNQASSSFVYTAPPSIVPQHMLSGCMVLPSDSVFNTRIDSLPVQANSDLWTKYTLSSGMFIGYQWGINIVDNSTPLTPLYFHYTTQLNGTSFPIPALPDKKRETGAFTVDSGNDHHVVMLNRDTCQIYESYQDNVAVDGCPNCNAASGWTYPSTSYVQPTDGTTDAAGLPITPLTLHLSEIKAGVINHALRFTACLGCISPQFLWPATGSTAWQNGAPPMGARFRLKASYDISGYAPAAQVVLRALRQYGMILADVGTSGAITASSDVTEDATVVQQLSGLTPTYSDFEVVDESSLMLSPASSEVNPANGYVVPANYAVLKVTDAANPANTVQVPVVIQPIGVGTPDPTITVQAGTPGFPIKYWVTGTANQNVTWSISPASGLGSIGPDGTYTAPANVAGPAQATVTATSVVDPTASTSIQINVIPAGIVRIDSGSTNATVDDSGNTWLPDIGHETGGYANINDSYPVGAWGKNASVYQTYIYTWGDDIVYRFHVPNGSYTVGLTLGIGGCSGQYNTGSWDNGLIWGPLNIETQGQIILPNWNLGTAINFQCRTANTVSVPAMVTDTNLEIALRATGGNGTHSAPILNALTIQPTTVPYQALLTTSTLNFGNQLLGAASTVLSTTIWNSGNAPLPISGASITGPNAADFAIASNGCPATLAVGSSCQISVSFTPIAGGTRSATLNIAVGSPNSPEVVSLVGAGLATPQASLTPSALVFSNISIGNASASQTVTLSNPGNWPLAISNVAITGQNATDFSISANGCPASLAVNASCQISVTFNPTAMGARSAALTFTDSAAGSTQSISLSGMGNGVASHVKNSAYAYTMPITINHQLVPNTDQVNFPILFSGTYSFLATTTKGGSVQNANGYDIIFASDAAGVNKLNFERVAYDPTTGTVRYWVQVPTVSHTADSVIYLLYGSSVTNDPSSPSATWNNNYKAVWHLDEASGTTLYDSTGANSATKTSASDPLAVPGFIGGGQFFTNTTFNGSSLNNFALTAASPATNITANGITVSVLMNCNSTNVYGGIYRRTAAASDSVTQAQVALTVNEQSGGDVGYWVNGSLVDFGSAYTPGTWAFLTVTHNFSTGLVSLYLNGVLSATKTLGTVPASNPGYIDVIGNRAYGWAHHNFPGTLDELKVAASAMTPDWIATEYNNETNPSAFYSVGSVPAATQSVSLNAMSTGSASHVQNSAYAYTMPITINHQLVPNTDQASFPMLFSGTYSFLAAAANGGSVQNANGYDIIFASDPVGVNKLNFERSAYDPTTGTVRYWVQVPTLSHTADTVIYLLYGDSVTSDPSNPSATWNNNYKAVWHLDETSGATLYDSTGVNNATKTTASDPRPVPGLIGGGQLFTNTTFTGSPLNNFAQTASGPGTNVTANGITISVLMNCNSTNVYGGIYRRTAAASDSVTQAQVALTVNEQAGGDLAYWVNGTMVDFAAAYAPGTWTYITVTHNFSTGLVSLYRNGALVATNTLGSVPVSNSGYIDVIGNRAYAWAAHNFPGTLDELKVSGSAMTADWIATEYNNQTNLSAFYSFGAVPATAQPASPVATAMRVSAQLLTTSAAPQTAPSAKTVTASVATPSATPANTATASVTTPSATPAKTTTASVATPSATPVKTATASVLTPSAAPVKTVTASVATPSATPAKTATASVTTPSAPAAKTTTASVATPSAT
ncbi:MAG: DUF2341 domain-containing protein, partial [Acidobacteriaceae bacterium]|nr:DUF2341 domain-containing protein [Acidobacteriaceae bacterium]